MRKISVMLTILLLLAVMAMPVMAEADYPVNEPRQPDVRVRRRVFHDAHSEAADA